MRQILNGSTGYYQPITLVEEVKEETQQIIMVKENKPSRQDELFFETKKELIFKSTLSESDRVKLTQLNSVDSRFNRL